MFDHFINGRLKKKYRDDFSINSDFYLNLWLEAYLVNPIKIRYMIFLILQLKIYEWLTMFQSLEARNRFWALKF